jgi:hypothetical protein
MVAPIPDYRRTLMAMLLPPVVSALEATMTVVILRRQLALIARRQVPWILRVMRIRAARIVLLRTAVVPIPTVVALAVVTRTLAVVVARVFGLENPYAISAVRLCRQARAQPETEQDE